MEKPGVWGFFQDGGGLSSHIFFPENSHGSAEDESFQVLESLPLPGKNQFSGSLGFLC